MKPTTPVAEITEKNIHTDPESGVLLFEDEAATKLVLDDTEQFDAYINVNQWAARWVDADTIYQSPEGSAAFEGGASHVPVFTVSNHMSSLVPKMVEGLFYGDPPFLLRPAPNVAPEITRSKAALFTFQMQEMKCEEECERAIEQQALLGTCIMKWGWLDDV